MSITAIDRLATRLGRAQLDRRSALKGGAGTLGIAATALLVPSAPAQEATPAADGMPANEEIEFLFVQTGASGSFVATGASTEATPAVDGVNPPDYLLTIDGHHGSTIYFSDRPDRIFGDAPTPAFLDGLGFTPADPPNAAIVAQTTTGEEDILLVELFNPVFDADSGTLTYGASVLSAYAGDGLDHVETRQGDQTLSEQFSRVSLFIDGCSSRLIDCHVNPIDVPNGDPWNLGKHSMCYNWSAVQCQPCAGIDALTELCNETYPDDCQGKCWASPECPTMFC